METTNTMLTRTFRNIFLTGVLFLLFPELITSQIQPLSRNDKAQVAASLKEYERNLENQVIHEAARHLNDIAYLYWEHNDYINAIKYYEQSLLLNKELNNENGMAMINNNLGMLYSDIEEFDKALDYFEQTLAARRAFKNKEGIVAALKNMSVATNNLARYDESIELLNEALAIERESMDINRIASCYLMLSESYEKAGDIANTKYYYDLYKTLFLKQHDLELSDKQQLVNDYIEKSENQELQLQQLNEQLNSAQKALNEFDAQQVLLSDSLSKKEMQVRLLEAVREVELLKNEYDLSKATSFRNMILLVSASILLILFLLLIYFYFQLLANRNELKKSNNELSLINSILKKYVYSASHDLKQPIINIKSFQSLFQNKYNHLIDNRGKKYLGIIENNIKFMERMLDDFLAYANIIKKDNDKTTIDLNKVIDDIKKLHSFDQANIRVSDLPQIYGNESQISRLFQNLFSNAVKFNDNKVPSITIAHNIKNGIVEIRVSDNGIGIKEEHLTIVFEEFQRTTTEQYEGTGLGLAMCKEIVANHGGQIRAENNDVGGTDIVFQLQTGE